jgi:hypothetical protein
MICNTLSRFYSILLTIGFSLFQPSCTLRPINKFWIKQCSLELTPNFKLFHCLFQSTREAFCQTMKHKNIPSLTWSTLSDILLSDVIIFPVPLPFQNQNYIFQTPLLIVHAIIFLLCEIWLIVLWLLNFFLIFFGNLIFIISRKCFGQSPQSC